MTMGFRLRSLAVLALVVLLGSFSAQAEDDGTTRNVMLIVYASGSFKMALGV